MQFTPLTAAEIEADVTAGESLLRRWLLAMLTACRV